MRASDSFTWTCEEKSKLPTADMAEATAAAASKAGPPPLDPDSVWTKIQQAGVTVPADVIDKLAELDLELSEGEDCSHHS